MYSFIINPNARSGKGLRAWKLIEKRLEEKSVPYQVFFTKYQGHATQIARTLTQEKDCRSLIVLGGDGTLNEAVNGIARSCPGHAGLYPHRLQQRLRPELRT